MVGARYYRAPTVISAHLKISPLATVFLAMPRYGRGTIYRAPTVILAYLKISPLATVFLAMPRYGRGTILSCPYGDFGLFKNITPGNRILSGATVVQVIGHISFMPIAKVSTKINDCGSNSPGIVSIAPDIVRNCLTGVTIRVWFSLI